MRLCIVPCGKSKVWDKHPDKGPTKARDVYIGPYAKTCKKYAEKFYPDSYVILSAKYGFLFPDEKIPGPYNVSFKDKSTNPISVDELRDQAKEKGLIKWKEIVVIAGRNYAEIVRKVFPNKKIVTPLEGVGGMGSQMSVLNRAVEQGRELGIFSSY